MRIETACLMLGSSYFITLQPNCAATTTTTTVIIIIIINRRNNLLDTKIRRQQGSQKLPTYHMLNDRVQNPNRNNS